MSSEPKFEITYFDTQTNRLASIEGQVKKAIEYMLGKMQKVGDYELSEFTAKAGVEANAWVLKANGSIEMKWTKPKTIKSDRSGHHREPRLLDAGNVGWLFLDTSVGVKPCVAEFAACA